MSNTSTAPSVVVAFDETLPDFEPEPVRRPVMKTGLVNTFKALPLTLDRGDGVWVWDTDGRQYLDLYSGHAVASTGHAHPHVAGAIAAQARRLLFYSNVVDLEVRNRATEKLLSYIASPGGITRALFANSGAEAIENALKMAIRHTGRKKIVAFEGGFHGRTLLACNVTGNPKYRSQAPFHLDDVVILPFGDADALGDAIDDQTAAVIVEPVQSMAGCRMADKSFYQELRAVTSKHGALLVYDEVQTGVGRTGRMFFSGRDGIAPDLICLAKGIASGFPVSAVLVSETVADGIGYGEYGATYGAGPIAMAAMLATLEVIEHESLLANVAETGSHLVRSLVAQPGVEAVHGLGFLLGVRTGVRAAQIQSALLERGIIVGTSDDPFVFRLLPPLILQRPEADAFLHTFAETLGELS